MYFCRYFNLCSISLVNNFAVYVYENLLIAAERILSWKFIYLFGIDFSVLLELLKFVQSWSC